jgi:O-antigen ligase
MEHTFNYLKNLFQEIKSETKQNPTFVVLIFVLISIPLGYAINGIAVALFVLITLVTLKKSNIRIDKNLIYPIVLYFLMVISIFWTRDSNATLKALSKTIPLLVLPLCFMIFPKFSNLQRQKIISYYSYGMLLFILYYLVKAGIRFAVTHNTNVFFYHELVTEDVNSIHVSLYMAFAGIYFITKFQKSAFDKIAITIITVFLVLLSSKNISVIFFGLVVFFYLRYYKSSIKIKSLKIIAFSLLFLAIAFTGKIKDRFMIEYYSNVSENSLNHEIGNANGEVHNVSIHEAWNNSKFSPNDFFNGTAFRVYQARLFFEFLIEEPIFWKGFGLNASQKMLIEKEKKYNLYNGYGNFNFHNQYIQISAELGIFGLLLLLIMLLVNIKNAIKTKDFAHISFAILMISLFLTESFLSRQRGIVFFSTLYCLFNSESIPNLVLGQSFFIKNLH